MDPVRDTILGVLRNEKPLTEEFTQNNKLAARFIPNSITVYAIWHQDVDADILVPPIFRSERRANVRCDKLKARTGEEYFVEPVELRD